MFASKPVVEGLPRRARRAARFPALTLLLLLACALPVPAQDAGTLADAESSAPAPDATLQGAQLLAALRRGGYVVYFRHTATDFSRDDSRMTGYADCANQRPLNEQGRRDARAIGATLRELDLPVSEALASPFCRTMEHARLMLVDVSPRMEVREAQAGDYAGLKRLLAAPVAAGGNRWIVGHGIPFRAVAGPPHLAEGEAAVIRPGTTGWTVVARLQVADWQTLVSAAR
jgi:hypothetical protein